MNVLPSSPNPSSAAGVSGTSGRGDGPSGDEPGAFAEVLGQRMQHASRAGDPADAPIARLPRAATRKPQDPADREVLEASALPLIAAALESRSVAMRKADTAAASDRDVAAKALGGDATRAGTPVLPGPATDADAALAPESAPTGAAQAGAAPWLRLQGDQTSELPQGGPATAPERGRPQAAKAAVPPATPLPDAAAPASRSIAAADAAARPVDSAPARSEPANPARVPPQEAAPEHDAVRASSGGELAAGPSAAIVAGVAPAAPVAPPAATSPLTATGRGYVEPPVGHQAWGPALGQEVARMHHAGHGQAQLELNPPGLGPLSVSLSVADQQAQAVFVSPHPAVRAAVEAALPQLRSALAESGISLGQASVGSEHQQGSGAFSQPSQDHAPQRRPAAASFAAPERPAATLMPPRRSGGHVLDTFA